MSTQVARLIAIVTVSFSLGGIASIHVFKHTRAPRIEFSGVDEDTHRRLVNKHNELQERFNHLLRVLKAYQSYPRRIELLKKRFREINYQIEESMYVLDLLEHRK